MLSAGSDSEHIMDLYLRYLFAAIGLASLNGCVAVATVIGDPEIEDPEINDPTEQPSWTYETVAELSAELNGLDVALDDSDRLHISLVDGNDLDYLAPQGDRWLRDPVDRAGGREGNPSAIRVDESGQIHHAYWKGGYVMWAQGEEASWSIESIRKLSSATNPFISLGLSTSTHIALRHSGRAWHIAEEEDWAFHGLELGYAQWNALEFDDNGTGHLFVVDHLISQADIDAQLEHGVFAIRHAKYEDGEWHTQPAIEAHDGWLGYPHLDFRGRLPSTSLDMALDDEGRPHLAYFYAADPDDPATPWVLRYAVQTEQGWSLETIDEQASVGYHVSLALGPDGTPHVSYYHDKEQQLFYGTRLENGWFTEPIEPGTTHGPRSQISVTSDARVSVVYPSEGRLRMGVLGPASD